jgi:hypothetical protein
MASSPAGSPTSAAILYPTGDPVINWIDTIVILYTTPWAAGANLTLTCQLTLESIEGYMQQASNPSKQLWHKAVSSFTCFP